MKTATQISGFPAWMQDGGRSVEIRRVRDGGIEIAYDMLGPDDGEPLLLIMGMGSQLIEWPTGFCQALVDRGFQLVRFDNRDSGASTHLTEQGVPNPLRMFACPESVAPYRLSDMAADAVRVLDDVGWPSAHVVGVSMGGIVAQAMAINHPDRLRSLTAISSTPWWRLGRQPLRTTLRAALIYKRAVNGVEQAAQRAVDMARILASPAFPFEEADARETGRLAYERDPDETGLERQNAAVIAGPDLRAGLAKVRLPTLVIHGSADVMIRPAGGKAIAQAVRGARWVTYLGMNHDLPRALWPSIADKISQLARATAPMPGSRMA